MQARWCASRHIAGLHKPKRGRSADAGLAGRHADSAGHISDMLLSRVAGRLADMRLGQSQPHYRLVRECLGAKLEERNGPVQIILVDMM